jgi:uncharacterized membrane protein YeaQ/YmgE (transglycosylase-associated protein family)
MLAADISFWAVVWYAIAGLIIGLIARAIMPGRQQMGLIVTIVLGVVSAIAGAFLWNAIFKDQSGVAWIGGVVVACLLLWAYSRLAPRMNRSGGPPA